MSAEAAAPPEGAVTYISLPQADLVAALERYLERARCGEILSFVGVMLPHQGEEFVMAMDGLWTIEALGHIGALSVMQGMMATMVANEGVYEE